MSQNETSHSQDFSRYLPVATEARAERPSLVRISSDATFLSQMIAERQRLPLQREKRRAPVDEAVGAYATGATRSVRRMPAGYRHTGVA
ncbi:hypothetical protein [Paradevosia shaoguanensis]|jgi:hypothetical protein|uniref:Uncharacterized protein n=1 Tax=Paradevosia shaoguanensis TaxID=1335043 RepID=A0AA41QTD8_9HYPH|nr:hypothetical protein [Paradevosia shaoguanensis]KFL25435.1 hypothetical protein JP74_19255 [Devosia sp. 17-2-E-8]MBI4046216.1 hypothetical protein [Devosia nanyangense]QMV00337.1 hypothetical protein GHV40_01980 [Devosia sp. D6-9]CDP53749.1 hypothetical protein [Devosia sp. DBB001]MCF1744823.1 hypothetical protein [Paradevosia shaoguanensis]